MTTDNVTALATFALPEPQEARTQLQAIRTFQAVCKELMILGSDYGVIPGTQKPTLLKPGAEKVLRLLGLADEYDILQDEKNWATGFFHFQVRCRAVHLASGQTVTNGLGECNSMESKYRWRWIWERELPPGFNKPGAVYRTTRNGGKQYRAENEDIYSQVNTLLKMAKKRAMVDAALSAGRLSEIFTQDMEDIAPEQAAADAATPVESPAPKRDTYPEQEGVPPEKGYTPVLTEAHLRALILDEGMRWDHFEIQVLGKSWAEFIKVRGATPAVALARWETWKTGNPGKVALVAPPEAGPEAEQGA